MENQKIGPMSPLGGLLNNVQKVNSKPDKVNIGTPHDVTHVERNKVSQSSVVDVWRDSVESKFKALESLIPIEILQNSLLMRAEWAWKRLLMTKFEEQVSVTSSKQDSFKDPFIPDDSTPTGGGAPSPLNPTVHSYEAVVRSLWNIMTSPLVQQHMNRWKAEWCEHEFTKNVLIPFAHLDKNEIEKQHSDVLKGWVVQDRLISAVQMDSYERIGQGLFVLPSQIDGSVQEAVKWQAKKQTRVTGQGILAHRIEIDVEVDASPLKCTLISIKPTILIHFSTDDIRLRKYLEPGGEELKEILAVHGWHLEQWTVGSFIKEEGAL